MLPADQRFRTDHCAGVEIDLGLVVQPQFVAFECATQQGEQMPAFDELCVHRLVEEAEDVAARGLGLRHGRVGLAVQGVEVGAIFGEAGDEASMQKLYEKALKLFRSQRGGRF